MSQTAAISIDHEAKRQIADLVRISSQLEQSISSVNTCVNQVNSSVSQLQAAFDAFRNDQVRSQAINRATTELVRVRQELEQKFSNYSVVRETMLGVLQATDLALVKKDTISRVSEELMLSTPEYWLAPCLVAVAAWIGNDRDLAERAIREAVRRDEAKTALTMALICRRNERQQTCYEWLSIYFAHQDSAHFSESTLMYIDAYVNGVFGNDEKHICDDYINKWMSEVRANSSNIEFDQEKIWKDYCSGFSYDTSAQFPDLKDCVPEYANIDAYIRRINSITPITDNFKSINQTEVNQETLKTNIDHRLIQLIGKYDTKEEGLKREEHYYDLVKQFGGDEQRARELIAYEEQSKRERTLNLVEQMTNVIVTGEDVMPSMKKTAVSFLSSYINRGFDSYIEENKAAFPSMINMELNGWKGQTQAGEDGTRLAAEYERQMQTERQQALNSANSIKAKAFWGGGIAAAIIGLICLINVPALGVLLLIGAGALGFLGFKSKKELEQKVTEINNLYDSKIADGKDRIMRICDQWKTARGVVQEFESRPKTAIIA